MRAALTQTDEHPEITFRKDALLRSMNDRLGGVIGMLGRILGALTGQALITGHQFSLGQDIEPLSRRYLAELLEFAVANHEDLEADFEERVSEMRQGTDG